VTADIDIIMPTYNRRSVLPRALSCICSQTFRRWRLIVINDGGEDVEDLVSACGDDRIEYFSRPHLGKAAQLNFALGRVTAKYIAYMDDDDVVYPEHLAKLHGAAERMQSDFVYSDSMDVVLSADGNIVSRQVVNADDVTWEKLRISNFINHKHVLHTRELSKLAGNYDEDMRILIDFDYIKRLVRVACNPFHVREITGEHYLQPASSDSDAITNLWQRDPAAAGRSLLCFFRKDPEALSILYSSQTSEAHRLEAASHVRTVDLIRLLLRRLLVKARMVKK